MKVAPAADWREELPFETPFVLADVVPGEDARCFTCGPDSDPHPRTEMWAYKHQHPNHHHGFVRLYCAEHVPAAVVVTAPASAPAVRARAVRAPKPPAPRPERTPARRSHADDKVRAMCPDCFTEVSARGVCGNCGNTIS